MIVISVILFFIRDYAIRRILCTKHENVNYERYKQFIWLFNLKILLVLMSHQRAGSGKHLRKFLFVCKTTRSNYISHGLKKKQNTPYRIRVTISWEPRALNEFLFFFFFFAVQEKWIDFHTTHSEFFFFFCFL